MFFSIDPAGGVPIYEQIVRQVKFAIAEQTLRPGQLLPSVRSLSHQLAINPNTIARAYLQLQADGMLESLRGRGMAVCDHAPDQCREFRLKLMGDRISMVLSEALHGGLTTDEISGLVTEKLKCLSGNVPTISEQPATPSAHSDDSSSASEPSK